MIAFKCKMCGGDLHPEERNTTVECEFCGTVQTIPTDNGEKKTTLFNRANRLRMNAEFDKASAIYERIAAEFPEEAEAYWGLCLCAYGIEYVDDPVSGEKKPTCHRTLTIPIMADSNFEQACENADAIARRVYREEAKSIDRIQKDILSIASNEEPYDVFICYKETAEEGGRTEDSVLGQEIYDSLVGKGLKVFFSRITLEDKLGQQYEPYIYSALSSAKVMLAIGTKFEYYDSVWVKNEWHRFLSMMKTEKAKTLIPCYKGLDAYDMPKEFNNLQGQDMGKLGWLQDLTRGVTKLCGKEQTTYNNVSIVPNSDPARSATSPLLRRAYMFLEDEDWENADKYAEKVLDIEPENAKAYLIKLMVEREARNEDELIKSVDSLSKATNYPKIMRFADESLIERMNFFEQKILERREQFRRKGIRDGAIRLFQNATSIKECEEAIENLKLIQGFKGVEEAIEQCTEKLKKLKTAEDAKEEKRNSTIYDRAEESFASREWSDAINYYYMLGDYKDSVKKIELCKIGFWEETYLKAIEYQKGKRWGKAIEAFELISDYKDTAIHIKECREAQIQKDNEMQAQQELEHDNYVQDTEVNNPDSAFQQEKKGLIRERINFKGLFNGKELQRRVDAIKQKLRKT